MERAEAEKLYEENEKLVYFVMNRYLPGVPQTEDLLQDGRIGLWKACLNFCPDRGTAFSTVAVRYIRTEILRTLRRSHAKQRTPGKTVPLDAGSEMEDGNCRTMHEVVPGDMDVDWVDTEAILGCLTERQKKYMRLSIQGYSAAEIGRMFGLTTSSISHELVEARKWIRKKGLL